MTDESSPPAFETGPGRRIAGYEVENEIGRGGMAIVYRARDVNLGRTVALKILAPQLARDESFRQRFMHESRAAAAVDHPHIIPVFEAGESAGALFLAMRYVPTGDVRSLIEAEGALPVDRTVAIVGQVAAALDAAHARGLIHRDIKPANMLLARSTDGQSDHVYLSDFGLSKQSLAPTSLTSTGQFLGTLDYVAPEQIEGRGVDGRADLYALACATMEMLTGAPPFRRTENVALMWAQLSEPPPRAADRRPDLPPAVDQVLGKALAKRPEARFAGCLDFAAALRAACLSPAAEATTAEGGLRAVREPTEVVPAEAAAAASAGGAPGAGGLPKPSDVVPASWYRGGGAPGQAPSPSPSPSPWSREASPSVTPGRPGGPGGWPADPRAASASARTARLPGGAVPPAPGGPSRGYQGGPSGPYPPGGSRVAGGPGPGGRPGGGPGSRGQAPGGPVPRGAMPGGPVPGGPARGGHRGLAVTALVAGVILAVVLAVVAIRLHARNQDAPGAGGASSPVVSAPATGTVNTPQALVALTPAQVVQRYYQLINQHRYGRAWLLGGDHSRAGITYPAYVAGFAGTARDNVRILQVNGSVVTARLTALQDNGTAKIFQGTYTVADATIMSFDVVREQ